MSSVSSLVKRHGVWLAVAVVVTVGVTIVTGWWLVAIYSAINLTGTMLHLDGISPRQRGGATKHRWFPVLAAVLVPVGIYGALASKGSSPTDGVRGDPDLRRDVARSSGPSHSAPGSGY